jgi:antitoxin YefM
MAVKSIRNARVRGYQRGRFALVYLIRYNTFEIDLCVENPIFFLSTGLVMNTVHLNGGSFDFPGVVAKVIANSEPTVVETEGGESVVLMPLEEFTSWQETAYLLGNPANAAHLRKSIAEA